MSGDGDRFPGGMRTAGRVVSWLLSRGVPMGPLRLLRTRGRRTGRARLAPVAVLRHHGDDWLVSPFGEVAWVHNVRANGLAALGRRGRFHAVALTEIDDEQVPTLLRAYRRRFALVPFVRKAFAASARDDLAAFARESARHPVFRIGDGRALDAPGTTAGHRDRPQSRPDVPKGSRGTDRAVH